MKKIYKTSFYAGLFTFISLTAMAQSVFETFNSPTQLVTTGGWILANRSTSPGTLGWFIGNPAVFSAYSPADTTYAGVNYNSTSSSGFPTQPTISNWLITPTFTISNGDVVSFFTRTSVAPLRPDRLQLRMSAAGTSTNVGSSPTSVGDFTVLAVDVNPTYTITGYPEVWTQYSYTVTGLSAPTLGRFAFRYFCENAGTSTIFGTNSNYVGVDDFSFCSKPIVAVNSGSICVGQSYTLAPTGATSYSYSGGNTVVNPIASSSYTITGFTTPVCSASAVSDITVAPVPSLTVNSGLLCGGQSFTINASGAPTITISNGNNTVVNPTVTTNYTVTGVDANGCESTVTNTVTVSSVPTLTVNSGSICAGQGFTISPTGAASYTISGGSSIVFPTVTTSYTVFGVTAEGCESTSPVISSVDVQYCTGIEANNQVDANVSVYPNPFYNSFNIDVITDTKVIISDIYGKLILDSNLNSGNNIINLSNYAEGIYFVNIRSGNLFKTIKVIKN